MLRAQWGTASTTQCMRCCGRKIVGHTHHSHIHVWRTFKWSWKCHPSVRYRMCCCWNPEGKCCRSCSSVCHNKCKLTSVSQTFSPQTVVSSRPYYLLRIKNLDSVKALCTSYPIYRVGHLYVQYGWIYL